MGERENGRARGRHIRAPVFSCAHYFQAPATQATYSALLLPLVLDSCCEGINFASQGKNRIRVEKEFLNSRVRSRPPTQDH